MMDTDAAIPEEELHAFVDGQLDAGRAASVLRHLQRHPDDAVRTAHWHAQRFALRRLHRAAEPGPTPSALTRTVLSHGRRGWSPWTQAFAALLLVAAGAFGMRLWLQPQAAAIFTVAAAPPQFVRDATAAYAVYAPEVRHPVEVTAQEQGHLVQWLSRRLGRPLTAPVLQSRGFRLLGGRLLPGEGGALSTMTQSSARSADGGGAVSGPAIGAAHAGRHGGTLARAQFMYEDARGRRITLYVAIFPRGMAPRETSFQSVESASGAAFYWVEDEYGYALNGDLPAGELQALAGDVYDQLFPR